MESYYSDYLRKLLQSKLDAGLISIETNDEKYFKKIQDLYSVSGNSVDWERLPGSISQHESITELQKDAFSNFFNRITDGMDKNLNIIYLCDGGVDFCIHSQLEQTRQIIAYIFSIPQHHYFLPEDFSWCMSFNMTGYMDFGFRISN